MYVAIAVCMCWMRCITTRTHYLARYSKPCTDCKYVESLFACQMLFHHVLIIELFRHTSNAKHLRGKVKWARCVWNSFEEGTIAQNSKCIKIKNPFSKCLENHLILYSSLLIVDNGDVACVIHCICCCCHGYTIAIAIAWTAAFDFISWEHEANVNNFIWNL